MEQPNKYIELMKLLERLQHEYDIRTAEENKG